MEEITYVDQSKSKYVREKKSKKRCSSTQPLQFCMIGALILVFGIFIGGLTYDAIKSK